MTLATSVVVMGGRPVVRKVADGADADRVRNEAALLEAAQHPGLVRIVGRGDDGSEAWLATEHAGRSNLSDLVLPSPLSCLAAVAATLADLHARGIVHGHVSGEHVVLDRHGAPRLCSIQGGPDPQVDVVALAHLAHGLAGHAPAAEQEMLRTLAGRVLHAADGRRPSMRALVDFLQGSGDDLPRADASGGHLDDSEARHANSSEKPTLKRGIAVAACLVGLCLMAVAAAGLSRGASTRGTRPDTPSTTASGSSESMPSAPAAAPSSTAAPASPPITRTWPPCPPGGPDLDGDGCGDAIRLDGVVAVSGDQRWQVAEPGELALLADWDCDQVLTVTVVRTDSGSVWTYDGWSQPGRETVARHVTTAGPVAGARVIEGLPGDDRSCAAIDLTLTSGEVVTVTVAV